MENRKEYEAVIIEVIEIEQADVITDSGINTPVHEW